MLEIWWVYTCSSSLVQFFCSQSKKERERVCACTCMDFHGVCELCNNTRKKVLKTFYKSKFYNKFYIWKLLRNENMITVHCFLNTKAQFSIPSSLDLAMCVWERESVCVCACVCCFVSTYVMCIAQHSCSSCLRLSVLRLQACTTHPAWAKILELYFRRELSQRFSSPSCRTMETNIIC